MRHSDVPYGGSSPPLTSFSNLRSPRTVSTLFSISTLMSCGRVQASPYWKQRFPTKSAARRPGRLFSHHTTVVGPSLAVTGQHDRNPVTTKHENRHFANELSTTSNLLRSVIGIQPCWLGPVFFTLCGGLAHQTSLRSLAIRMSSAPPLPVGRRVAYSVHPVTAAQDHC